MEVTLLRHGESLANAGLSDELDSALTAKGERQADLAGRWLEAEAQRVGPLTRALVSPFRRTLQTFQPTSVLTGVEAEIFPEICEYFCAHDTRYLSFAGLDRNQISEIVSSIDTEQPHTVWPRWWPGELEDTYAVRARAARVKANIIARFVDDDCRILLVSHAETIGRLAEAFMNVTPTDDVPWTENCGIWRFKVTDGGQRTETLLQNWQGHLKEV
ncbi:MAG TPA: histidine phosphatase family protein [Capsulimonadaceae bacterium]|jgi:broad specificity phosphatase PhoE